jgi:hypothetical protein
MEILDIPAAPVKDVFVAKTNKGYVGCVQAKVCFYFTAEVFNSALQAANAARRLRKNLSTQQETLTNVSSKILTKAKKSSKKPKNTVAYPDRLYTQAEVEAMPLLRFQEVWIILHGNEYVADCLNYEKKELVKYAKEQKKAKFFLCHEEAKRTMRTLRGVVGPKFDLMRVFIRTDM